MKYMFRVLKEIVTNIHMFIIFIVLLIIMCLIIIVGVYSMVWALCIFIFAIIMLWPLGWRLKDYMDLEE